MDKKINKEKKDKVIIDADPIALHALQGEWMSNYHPNGMFMAVDFKTVTIQGQKQKSLLGIGKLKKWRWNGYTLLSVSPDGNTLTWESDFKHIVIWTAYGGQKTPLIVDCDAFKHWKEADEFNRDLPLSRDYPRGLKKALFQKALLVLRRSFSIKDCIEDDHQLCVLRYKHSKYVLGVCTLMEYNSPDGDSKVIVLFCINKTVRKNGFPRRCVKILLQDNPGYDLYAEVRVQGDQTVLIHGQKLVPFWRNLGFSICEEIPRKSEKTPKHYFNSCIHLKYDTDFYKNREESLKKNLDFLNEILKMAEIDPKILNPHNDGRQRQNIVCEESGTEPTGLGIDIAELQDTYVDVLENDMIGNNFPPEIVESKRLDELKRNDVFNHFNKEIQYKLFIWASDERSCNRNDQILFGKLDSDSNYIRLTILLHSCSFTLNEIMKIIRNLYNNSKAATLLLDDITNLPPQAKRQKISA